MTDDTPSTPAADARLTLTALGEPALFRSGPDAQLTRLIGAGKSLALLVYLACARGREAHRDELCELLWSDREPGEAQSLLRQAVLHLKSKVGLASELIVRRGEHRERLALVAAIETDREEFLAARAAGDAEAMVRLYRGDFLAGFAAPGGPRFDDWAEAERVALRRLFVHAAEELVRARLSGGRAREALALAKRVRDLEPLNQAAWRRVLECGAAAGDVVSSRIELDAFVRLMADEDVELEGATHAAMREVEALLNGVRTGTADRGVASRLSAELVGRDFQFATLLRAWDDAQRGRLRQFAIAAPAGLGKTRLLLDLRQRLAITRAHVVYARAAHGAQSVPYSFAAEIAALLAPMRGSRRISPHAAGTIVALNPSLSPVYDGAARDVTQGDEALRRRALALRELITAVADDEPLALLLDDLHWADAGSYRALDMALGTLESDRLLVATTARAPGEYRMFEGAERINLDPLSDDDVAALMASVARVPDDSAAGDIAHFLRDATGGSPLLLLETLQFLVEQSVMIIQDEAWRVQDAAALAGVLSQGNALRRRIDGLDAEQRQILLLLAVAGVRLHQREIARAAATTGVRDVTAPLATLERQGYLVRVGDVFDSAHDEQAAAVIAAAPDTVVREAYCALGETVAAEVGNDWPRLCLAGSLLARGGDAARSQLSAVFRRFVRTKRLEGDRTSDRALARALLGDAATPASETELVRSLPVLVRARLVSPLRVAAAIAIALLLFVTGVGAWTILSRTAPRPDAVLLVRRLNVDRTSYEMFPVPIDASRWAGVSIIDVPLSGRRLHRKVVAANGGLDLRPDGHGWTGGVSLADSGVIDIFDFGLDGSARRLTFARLDDYEPSWAPDNSRFVFVTSRWSQHGHYDLAIYDTLTRAVQHLTDGDDTDDTPKWSPDGSRIAFSRLYAESGGRGFCVIDAGGGAPRCRTMAGPSPKLIGWADAHRVYLRRDIGGRATLVRFDLEADSVDFVDDRGGETVLSPDGRFAVCQCPRQGYPDGTWIVYPVERPGEFAVVHIIGADQRAVEFSWAPATPRAPWASHLDVSTGLGLPVLGTTHQLRAEGLDSAGHSVPLGVVRWRSEDTTVATIDSTGRLAPRRAGRVSIVASAGGWREVHKTLIIGEPAAHVLLDEHWTGELSPRWRPFGVPWPVVVSGAPFGRAFLNNGDGSFFSGAYTTESFDTRNGLWVEAELSTPITASESQEQVISLVNMAPQAAAWAAWDHATGDGPPGISTPSWGIRYPNGVGGTHFGDQIGIGLLWQARDVEMPPSARKGQPFRLVLQIFPDGRCAVAVDGRALAVSSSQFLEPAIHVLLAGNSVGTKILIGHLRVATGLAPGINWESRLPARPMSVR